MKCHDNSYLVGERPLTDKERQRAKEQLSMRTRYEETAFMLLPRVMKDNAMRNVPVAFLRHRAFYPDILLYKEKILIEIDGWQHQYGIRKKKDNHRDAVFAEHGYVTIRIKNRDVNCRFREKLVEGLSKIKPIEGRNALKYYIEMLKDPLQC